MRTKKLGKPAYLTSRPVCMGHCNALYLDNMDISHHAWAKRIVTNMNGFKDGKNVLKFDYSR